MKKKSLINLGLLAVLAAGLLYILLSDDNGSSTLAGDGADYDFSIEDTSAVSKIVIISRDPDTATLKRMGSGWVIQTDQGDKPAREDAVDVLLETFHDIKLRNFPPKSAEQTILRRMAGYGKEVQVYQGDELVQNFIVGTDNNDMLGTYIMRKNGQQPYAMHIPQFNGYLSSRFFTREDLWRDRTIFGIADPDIKKVSMDYEYIPQEGFTIEQTPAGALSVYDNSGTAIEPFNSQHTRYLLASLRTLNYEGAIIDTDEVWPKKDSIINSIPVFELEVVPFEGEKMTLSAFHVPAEPDTYDDAGNLMRWDPDRFYAYISDGRFVLIQAYAFENILKTREYFNL